MKNDQEDAFDEDLSNQEGIPEVVLTDLMKTNDRIELMTMKEVIAKLKCFHLDTQGSDSILRETLKTSYKKVLLAGRDLSLSSELLPYYVIIDFEATCKELKPPNFIQEIIEFPAVLVSSKEQKIVDCFKMYCKPQINPIISKFCSNLTGITQEQVDSAETFDKVLEHFQKWLKEHQLGVKYKFNIVTDGPWDMSRFLFSQCYYSNIEFPKWGSKWINLKKAFTKFYNCERISLGDMLEYLDMKFIGRPHCGLDDAKNIARILLKMIYDGANIQINEKITGLKKQIHRIKNGNNCSRVSEGDKVPKFRVKAHYKPVYYVEQMPVYKRTKRERLIAETSLARKILKSSSKEENSTCEKKSKKPLRKCCN